ncbi:MULTISPECIES: DUF2076 domain-containing protein [Raoultella]|uniref:DUF2076 domain-containing protein n=1 Tax=Raoultella TaxID=160674 RepID=UPI001F3DC5B7|nr:DUF2076 domain-containing protein [Raoultella planticola]MCE9858014.1 DUF2076 domain-containing protein [Raoultella planticola]
MTDITELAQSEINDALAQLKQLSEYPTPSTQYARVLRKYIATLVEALEKAQQRIEELESDLSEWTDCKHDGATYYDMSGQERCGRCGADV